MNKKINIATKMGDLINNLIYSKPFGEVLIPIYPECRESWSDDYAIVEGFYFDSSYDESKYFDEETLIFDFEKYVANHFGVDEVRYESYAEKVKPKVGELVVRMYYGSQEIEAYYQS